MNQLSKALMILGIILICCPAIIFLPWLMGGTADEFCPDCGRKIG